MTLGPLVSTLETARALLVPALKELEDVAFSAPPNAQLLIARSSRAFIKPLLDAMRGMLEPVADLDNKLSVLEKQHERT